jgi:hypothetical protein
MKTIGNWEDMRRYGVMYLTGESCSYGRRLLCDLTEKGARSVARFFGIASEPPGETFAINWNQGGADDPHVASIMLPRFGFLDELAVFCALDQGAAAVVVRGEGPVTVFESDEDLDEIGWDRKSWWISDDCKYESLRGCKIYSNVGRNEHKFSGRVA